MDKAYADTVRLLLNVAPDVFRDDVFAMKGGTAINLFVDAMPRLSVDIDLVYTRWDEPRDRALSGIASELSAIAERLTRLGLTVRTLSAVALGNTKLLVDDGTSQVKVEVNAVFRGTVLPPERRSLHPSTANAFSAELSVPLLAVEELYGSKLVAALDRQHPRDLFDVWRMYQTVGLNDATVECFVVYLAGHNRPIHEVLFPNAKDIGVEFRNSFVGMTTEPVELKTLLDARERLFHELPQRLSAGQRTFLKGLAGASPDWSLLACPHAAELPALQWKLVNLTKFSQRRKAEFERQADELEHRLSSLPTR